MKAFARILAAAVLVLGGSAAVGETGGADTVASNADPIQISFRDVFRGKGKPSRRASSINGKVVSMVGFMAPPPDDKSNFIVLVGEPTTFCPYCSAVSEHDHLPFVLVYPSEPVDVTQFGPRTRLRVTGHLVAEHGYEDSYGFHRDVIVESATIERDTRNQRTTPRQRRQKAQNAGQRVGG